MDDPEKTIAVVRGGSNADVEQTFRTLVDRWQPTVRLAGLIAENHGLADRACNAGFLRNVATAERFSIFQDLGPGSTVCHLDGAGALSAAGAVRRDIAAGCELVLLNKFGQARSGRGRPRGRIQGGARRSHPPGDVGFPRFRGRVEAVRRPTVRHSPR